MVHHPLQWCSAGDAFLLRLRLPPPLYRHPPGHTLTHARRPFVQPKRKDGMLERRGAAGGRDPVRGAVVLRRKGSEGAPVVVAAATMRGSVVVPPVGARRLAQRVRLLWISAAGSVKVKLLLTCCIAFTVALIAGRAFSATIWRHHLSVQAQPLPRRGYAVLINTWKRNDLLKKSVQHYASCSGVDSIHIIWSEADPPSDSLFTYLKRAVEKNSRDGKNIELNFDLNLEDSLNNRFKDIKELTSDAIFSIDDDVLFPCTSVEFAFSVWRSAPATLVGFVPRLHWLYKSARYMTWDRLVSVAWGATMRGGRDASMTSLHSTVACRWWQPL